MDVIQAAMVALDKSEEGRTMLGNLKIKSITTAQDGEWDDIRAMNLKLLNGLIAPSP